MREKLDYGKLVPCNRSSSRNLVPFDFSIAVVQIDDRSLVIFLCGNSKYKYER